LEGPRPISSTKNSVGGATPVQIEEIALEVLDDAGLEHASREAAQYDGAGLDSGPPSPKTSAFA
jgi:hypothetical protein